MVPEVEDPYRGKLTASAIADGMNAATRNANRLAADARLLFEHGRFASAASLAILGIEEAGKPSVLRQLALSRDEKELREAWRDYRSHTKKNVAWILPPLVAQGARKLDDFRKIFDASSEHPEMLDEAKQLGFYTDCVGKVRWTDPSETITKQFAEGILVIADIMCKSDRGPHQAREIELWIEHIGPVWKKDMAWMKQGLLNWYSAMGRRGSTRWR